MADQNSDRDRWQFNLKTILLYVAACCANLALTRGIGYLLLLCLIPVGFCVLVGPDRFVAPPASSLLYRMRILNRDDGSLRKYTRSAILCWFQVSLIALRIAHDFGVVE